MTRTRVGFSGGTVAEPSYEDVCSGKTGHAEVVEVTYDPERVSYDELLGVFWRKHDPTRRTGRDQYRSLVFFHDEAQRRAALGSQARLDAPIVTEIAPARGSMRPRRVISSTSKNAVAQRALRR